MREREDIYKIWSVIKCACLQLMAPKWNKKILQFSLMALISVLFCFALLFLFSYSSYIGTLMLRDSRCVLTMYRHISFFKKVPKYDKLYSWKSFSHALCFHLNRRYRDLITATYRPVHLCVCLCWCVRCAVNACMIFALFHNFIKIGSFMSLNSFLVDGFHGIQLLSGLFVCLCAFRISTLFYTHLHARTHTYKQQQIMIEFNSLLV